MNELFFIKEILSKPKNILKLNTEVKSCIKMILGEFK